MRFKVIDISRREALTPEELERILENALREVGAKTIYHVETLESYGWIIVIYD